MVLYNIMWFIIKLCFTQNNGNATRKSIQNPFDDEQTNTECDNQINGYDSEKKMSIRK